MSSQEKEGFGERNSRFWRNVHWVGAAALLGASVIATPVAAGLFETGAAWEGVHGGIWEGLRRHFRRKRETKAAKA